MKLIRYKRSLDCGKGRFFDPALEQCRPCNLICEVEVHVEDCRRFCPDFEQQQYPVSSTLSTLSSSTRPAATDNSPLIVSLAVVAGLLLLLVVVGIFICVCRRHWLGKITTMCSKWAGLPKMERVTTCNSTDTMTNGCMDPALNNPEVDDGAVDVSSQVTVGLAAPTSDFCHTYKSPAGNNTRADAGAVDVSTQVTGKLHPAPTSDSSQSIMGKTEAGDSIPINKDKSHPLVKNSRDSRTSGTDKDTGKRKRLNSKYKITILETGEGTAPEKCEGSEHQNCVVPEGPSNMEANRPNNSNYCSKLSETSRYKRDNDDNRYQQLKDAGYATEPNRSHLETGGKQVKGSGLANEPGPLHGKTGGKREIPPLETGSHVFESQPDSRAAPSSARAAGSDLRTLGSKLGAAESDPKIDRSSAGVGGSTVGGHKSPRRSPKHRETDGGNNIRPSTSQPSDMLSPPRDTEASLINGMTPILRTRTSDSSDRQHSDSYHADRCNPSARHPLLGDVSEPVCRSRAVLPGMPILSNGLMSPVLAQEERRPLLSEDTGNQPHLVLELDSVPQTQSVHGGSSSAVRHQQPCARLSDHHSVHSSGDMSDEFGFLSDGPPDRNEPLSYDGASFHRLDSSMVRGDLELRSGLMAPEPESGSNLTNWVVVDEMSGTGGVPTGHILRACENVEARADSLPWAKGCFKLEHKLGVYAAPGYGNDVEMMQKLIAVTGLPRQALIISHQHWLNERDGAPNGRQYRSDSDSNSTSGLG